MILKESDLRRLVRSVLFEGVLNDKIKRACDALGGAYLVVDDDGSRIIVRYIGLEEREGSRMANVDPSFVNAVHFEFAKQMNSHSPVMTQEENMTRKNIWVEKSSDALKGFGPLLYEVGIEYISSLGGAVMADTRYLSDDALKVWHIYGRRSDIKSEPMDFIIDSDDADNNPDTNILDYSDDWVALRYDDEDEMGVEISQRTPNDPSDDLALDSIFFPRNSDNYDSWANRVKNWKSSPLSHAFSKSDTSTIDYLKDLGKIKFFKI